MSAAPTSTQSNGPGSVSQTGPGTSNKKRKSNDRDAENQITDDEDMDEDIEYDSSDGELTLEEAESRKRRKAALRQQETELRRKEGMVAGIAQSQNIPNAASQISQAIYEYVRMLMGISKKSRSSDGPDASMPASPSEAEMKSWIERREDREELIRKAVDRAMRSYIASKPQGFIPNRKQTRTIEKDAAQRARNSSRLTPVKFVSRIDLKNSNRYAHSWATKCEAALSMAGFPRCTFDWDAGYDTPWNASMSSIIIEQWVKCFDSMGSRSFNIIAKDNTAENREEILHRWFTNKKVDYRKQNKTEILMKTAEGREQIKTNKAYSKKLVTRRRAKSAIYKARLSVVKDIFEDGSGEVNALLPREVHSEDEVGSTSVGKVRLSWRSAELDTFIALVDQTVINRETTASAKRAARHVVERGPYSTTPDFDVFPPKKYQQSLVSPTWLDSMPGVAIRNLKLQATDSVDIRASIQTLTQELAPKASTSQ